VSRTRINPFGQQAAKCYPISVYASTDNVSVGGGTNAAVAVALSAQTSGATEQGSWIVSEIGWSYAGTTAIAAGRLTVADSSGNLWDQDIYTQTSANFGTVTFNPPLASQVQNSALTITLGAVANVTGKLSVQGYLEI
jgi:hypothetical protein